MKLSSKLALIAFMLSCSTRVLFAQVTLPVNSLYARKYKIGETYRYKLTMSEYHNSDFFLTNVAVCELKVVDSAGVLADEVRWISKKVITAKDTTDQTLIASKVKPYRISLQGKGRIDLPKIEVTEMTEPIQDFNTFFIAVSPILKGDHELNKARDSISIIKPVTANFANGTSILKGEDCLAINAKLTKITATVVDLYTGFMAPKIPCLHYLLDEMNKPVVDPIPNNFQMVAPAGGNKYLVNYGREYFYINSSIRRSDGKILKATMFNQLNLKVKVGCTEDYKSCAIKIPFTEHRNLVLELL